MMIKKDHLRAFAINCEINICINNTGNVYTIYFLYIKY